MSTRPLHDTHQPARHLLGRLATMTPMDGGACRLCLVTQFQQGLVHVNANGATISDEFVLHFSGESCLSNGVYRVIWRNGLIVHAKLTKPIQQGLTYSQGGSRAWLG
jgi:hypothetical protein